LGTLASCEPFSPFKIVGRVSGSVTKATLSATVDATSNTNENLPSEGIIDRDRCETGGGAIISGASAKRCRSALIATSPSNCDDLDKAGRLLPGSPSVPGGIALRARKSSSALGAAMLGPPSPCGRRIDEMGFGTAVDPWMSGLRTAAASGAVGGASGSSRMSGDTGGDCESDGCDGLLESERRSPSGAASDALAGACVLRGRGIERLARALSCANAASMSVAAPIDVSIDALIGLLTGLSASLSAPDLSTPTGSSTAAGPSAPKG
jgi:hypothetical protein